MSVCGRKRKGGRGGKGERGVDSGGKGRERLEEGETGREGGSDREGGRGGRKGTRHHALSFPSLLPCYLPLHMDWTYCEHAAH
jgi:hypothetical protein